MGEHPGPARRGPPGLTLPEAYGGAGGTVFDLALVMEELARCCVATAFIVGQQNGFEAKAIALFGTEAQRCAPSARDRPRRAAHRVGHERARRGIGPAQPGLPRAPSTATRYVIDGRKTFCSLGGVSHLNVVICRFDGVAGFPGLGALLVEADAPGFSRGRDIPEMGLRGTAMADLVFEGCRVPAGNLLIAPGEFRKILQIMDGERAAGNPPMSLGIAQGALEEALHFAEQRAGLRAAGGRLPGHPLDAGRHGGEGGGGAAARLPRGVAGRPGAPDPFEASVAKAYTNEIAVSVCNDALQIHGGYGYTREFPVERMLRDARGLCIGDSTTQIQKNIIAKHLVKP